MAIQDRFIRTHNYIKHCLKLEIEDTCRKCGSLGETIEHVIAGCRYLTYNSYLGCHNQVAKIIQQQLAINNGLISPYPP